MSEHVKDLLVTGKARLVEQPAVAVETQRKPTEVDRTFELPTGLYAATVGCYIAFLGITFAAFSAPELAIPMVIFTLFIVAGFGVPTIWTRLKSSSKARAMSWGRFSRDGIMTNTGRLSAGEATIQILILPVLIVLWGCAAVTIAALV